MALNISDLNDLNKICIKGSMYFDIRSCFGRLVKIFRDYNSYDWYDHNLKAKV